MTKLRVLQLKHPASDPRVISYLQGLLKTAYTRRIEWMDIVGGLSKEGRSGEGFFSFTYPDPWEVED